MQPLIADRGAILVLPCRVQDQQLQDVSHQLQAMLDENQHLRLGRPPKAAPDAPASMDSSAVIEHRLLPFKDIKANPGVPDPPSDCTIVFQVHTSNAQRLACSWASFELI